MAFVIVGELKEDRKLFTSYAAPSGNGDWVLDGKEIKQRSSRDCDWARAVYIHLGEGNTVSRIQEYKPGITEELTVATIAGKIFVIGDSMNGTVIEQAIYQQAKPLWLRVEDNLNVATNTKAPFASGEEPGRHNLGASVQKGLWDGPRGGPRS